MKGKKILMVFILTALFMTTTVFCQESITAVGYKPVSNFSLSSDAKNFLFLSEDQFYKMSLTDNKISPLSGKKFQRRGTHNIRWSGDGSKIAYLSNEKGYVFDFSSQKEILIGDKAVPYAWSPDGKKAIFAFEDLKDEGFAYMEIVNLSDKKRTRISDRDWGFWEAHIYWLSSGIYYVQGATDVRNMKLTRVDPQTAQVLDKNVCEGYFGEMNCVSPSGKKLIFSYFNMTANEGGVMNTLKIKDLASGKIQDLKMEANPGGCCWISDEEFLYIDGEYDQDSNSYKGISVYKISLNPVKKVKIASSEKVFHPNYPQYSSSLKELYFMACPHVESEAFQLYKVNIKATFD